MNLRMMFISFRPGWLLLSQMWCERSVRAAGGPSRVSVCERFHRRWGSVCG